MHLPKTLWLSALAALLAFTAVASAHFVFVVPQADPSVSRIIMSETLIADDVVDVDIIKGARFQLRGLDGKDTPLSAEPLDAGHMTMNTPGEGTRIVHGVVDLGVMDRAGTSHVLLYYPKTIIGDAFDARTVLGDSVPVEIVPIKQDGKGGGGGGVRLKLLVAGKPKAGAEIRVILPGNSEKKVTTDENGLSPVLEDSGRYGAWARFWEDKPGKRDDKEYAQIRHYATLVFDTVEAPKPVASKAAHSPEMAAGNAGAAPVEKMIDLPFATSSFGAVISDGWLYVYGGHIVPTHEYHTTSCSGEFRRLSLAGGRDWETLPGGPRLQGMNLAAFKGAVYRAGGMQSLNAEGDEDDNRSVATVYRFDPASGRWSDFTPLPQPRSSHDVAVVDGKLYVLGGWRLHGKDGKTTWPEQMYSLDLTDPKAAWTATPQPFQRRALIAAVVDGRIYAIGGFDPDSRPSLDVNIFDTRTATWSKGPSLPAPNSNGFAPAAAVVDGTLYASVGSGGFYRLNSAGDAWEPVAQTTPRIVHRAVPFGSKVLLLGGAADGDNMALIEAVTVDATGADR